VDTASPVPIEDAIEVFVRGFCFMRSFTHPYFAERMDGLWVLRDGPTEPGKTRWDPRKIEVITHGLPAREVARRIERARLGWHFVFEVHERDEDFKKIRAAFKEQGYRALGTEWLFAMRLDEAPRLESDPPVRRVTTPEEAERIRIARRGRKAIRDRDVEAANPEQRLYAVIDDKGVYGWVSSVSFGRRAWVADLFVFEKHRGKGFGGALMSALLQDDKEHGVEESVLVASSDGARLYPHLGYEMLGTLQVFCPTMR
jgi:GNAT superfamily N-acetyltransferase